METTIKNAPSHPLDAIPPPRFSMKNGIFFRDPQTGADVVPDVILNWSHPVDGSEKIVQGEKGELIVLCTVKGETNSLAWAHDVGWTGVVPLRDGKLLQMPHPSRIPEVRELHSYLSSVLSEWPRVANVPSLTQRKKREDEDKRLARATQRVAGALVDARQQQVLAAKVLQTSGLPVTSETLAAAIKLAQPPSRGRKQAERASQDELLAALQNLTMGSSILPETSTPGSTASASPAHGKQV